MYLSMCVSLHRYLENDLLCGFGSRDCGHWEVPGSCRLQARGAGKLMGASGDQGSHYYNF